MPKSTAATTASPVSRGRTRTPEAAPNAKPTATLAMKQKAKEFYVENKAANAATSKADKARKALLGLMDDGKVETFEFKATSAEEGGTPITLVVQVGNGDVTTIDIQKLEKLVTREQFLRIVGATKTAITNVVGEDIYNQVATTSVGTGKRAVTVKPLG